MYADTYKPTNVGHNAEEATWDKLSELDQRMEHLEDMKEYLTVAQSVAPSDTPTTISVPGNQPTEASSLASLTSALVAALAQAGVGSASTQNGKQRKWKKIQHYCYIHGANASHASKDCKTPLGDHLSKTTAT